MVLATVLAAVATGAGSDVSGNCSRFVSVNRSFDGVISRAGSEDSTAEAGGVAEVSGSDFSTGIGGGKPGISSSTIGSSIGAGSISAS